jgi:serine/threonine-protein kinase
MEDRFPDAFTMKTELIAALDAKAQPLRGIEKTHDRGAPIAPTLTGAPGQGIIGLWSQGATQAAGAGPAEALVAAGYQVKRINTSTDSVGCNAIVVVPTPSDNHLTIAAKLAQMSSAPPVLLCGHEDDLSLMTKAIEAGIYDFVPLPLDATDLVKKITRALRRRKR